MVLLYASLYHDIPTIINVSGRLDMERGIEDRIGKEFMQRIKKDGFIDVKNKNGSHFKTKKLILLETIICHA